MGQRPGDGDRVDAIAERLVASEVWVRPKRAVDFGGGVKWRPHLVAAAGATRTALLHVVLNDLIQPYLVARLHAAQAAGWDVHLVVDTGSLHAANCVARLVGLDIRVHITKDDGTVGDERDLLATLGERGVALPRDTAVKLAEGAWQRRAEGNAHARGRRLEGLLAFLFGQVTGIRILDINLRTETEEIDIALQTEGDVKAAWYQSGVPFILVESKNWTSSVGQKEVSAFLPKIQFKRGRCRIGVMCAANGFTEDARNQELRLAATEYTIAMIGPKDIEAWIGSSDPTRWLNDFIARAMLR